VNLILAPRPTRLRDDITQAVGDVPIVRLRRVASVCDSRYCYLKLESCNPGGSIKEKNATVLVNQAEEAGLLQPGGTIIESSSGNFGVGLAIVGAARGYRVIIVVDAKTTQAFRRMLCAYGAELAEVSELDANGSMQKARIALATNLAETIPGGWYPCQHYNPNNPDAHALLTAREIEDAFGAAGGLELDALVVGISTGGQMSGLARYLKPRYPNLQLVGVDVQGSVIFDPSPAPYKMTGIGLSFRPPNLDYDAIDTAYVVPENLAYSMCHALAQREGLLLGSSTGAIVSAGLHLAAHMPPGSRVAMINPDRGDRYLETIYDSTWLHNNGFTLIPAEHMDVAIEQLCICESHR
jgi:cysteine synthase A